MNKTIENILLILQDKAIDSHIKSSIFNIIKKEIEKEKTDFSKKDILDIKKIFNEPEFNNFYVSLYPDYFINNKEGLLNSIQELNIDGIIKKLPLLLNYKDDFSYEDFKKITSVKTKDCSSSSNNEKKELFFNFCWENFFKEEFCFHNDFKKNLESTHYRWGIASKILTPILLKNRDKEPFATLFAYEEKQNLPFYKSFIIYQIFSSIYGDKDSIENLKIIKKDFEKQPEVFNELLMILLMNRRKDLVEKKKNILSVRKILLGQAKETFVHNYPYFNFESFLNEDLKKSIGEKNFSNFINQNNFETIIPFVIGNPTTNSCKEIIENYKIEKNIIKILAEFSEENPDIALYTFNQGINKFSGGSMSRLIKAIGEIKELEWDNIFDNSEHVKEVLFSFTDEEEFNNNLLKLRRQKHISLFNETALYSLNNGIKLDNTNLTYLMMDYFKNNISTNLFKKIKVHKIDLLEKYGHLMDYNIAMEYTWDDTNMWEKNFLTQIEKNKIYADLKNKALTEKEGLILNIENDTVPTKKKRM